MGKAGFQQNFTYKNRQWTKFSEQAIVLSIPVVDNKEENLCNSYNETFTTIKPKSGKYNTTQ